MKEPLGTKLTVKVWSTNANTVDISIVPPKGLLAVLGVPKVPKFDCSVHGPRQEAALVRGQRHRRDIAGMSEPFVNFIAGADVPLHTGKEISNFIRSNKEDSLRCNLF